MPKKLKQIDFLKLDAQRTQGNRWRENGGTRRDIAQKLNVAPGTVQSWMAGINQMPDEYFWAVEEMLFDASQKVNHD